MEEGYDVLTRFCSIDKAGWQKFIGAQFSPRSTKFRDHVNFLYQDSLESTDALNNPHINLSHITIFRTVI